MARQPLGRKKHISTSHPYIQPLGGFTGLISRLDCSRFGTFCVIALAVSILINVLLRRFTVALEVYLKKKVGNLSV